MSIVVSDIEPARLRSLLAEHGTITAVAHHLDVPRKTLSNAYARHKITQSVPSKPVPVRGLLTREALVAAMQPVNNCAVRAFLDQLDDEQAEIMEEALSYDKQDLPAARLREVLIQSGYDERIVPGQDAINNHRVGRRPCRCKG